LKNMISTYAKDSLRKVWPKFARFRREKNSKSPNFYNKFQQVAKNIYKVFF
jgi:hypothetical protein